MPTPITEPEVFLPLIASWRNEPRLWLDTEIADWLTTAPRLSLLQVRDGHGRVSVVDVLGEQMQRILQEHFVPEVMANASVEKWAHYARFEQRFLGQDLVRNLKCTFEMARSIPYYRLPLRSLSLGALVEHFFGQPLDKTLQKTDWRYRPLPATHLEYAAADAEWCHKVHDQLRGIPGPPEPSQDDGESIQTRYLKILCPLKEAKAIRSSIREAVRDVMVHRHLARLSRFSLRMRTTYSTSLAELVKFASLKDPGEYFDLGISLSMRLRSLLAAGVEASIRPMASIRVSQAFRGPRTPRAYLPSPPLYVIHEADVERLTRDYEAAEHNVLMLESERGELRERMRHWMQLHGLPTWGEFRFSEPHERWKVDARALMGVIPADTALQIAFPQRLWLAFREEDLENLIAAGQSREVSVLRWLPRALSVGSDAQESRDWEAIEDGSEQVLGNA